MRLEHENVVCVPEVQLLGFATPAHPQQRSVCEVDLGDDVAVTIVEGDAELIIEGDEWPEQPVHERDDGELPATTNAGRPDRHGGVNQLGKTGGDLGVGNELAPCRRGNRAASAHRMILARPGDTRIALTCALITHQMTNIPRCS